MILDYDGTLTPIRPRPEQAVLSHSGRRLLDALSRRHRVVLLSGRDVASLRRLAGPGSRVGLVGTHGAECSNLGRFRLVPRARERRLRRERDAALRSLRRAIPKIPGVQLEAKALSLALHFRRARLSPRQERALLRTFRSLARRGASPGLWAFQAGKKMIDWKPRGFDKGSAVRSLRRRFKGMPVLVAGDDLTDRDAFRAAGRGAFRAAVGKTLRNEPGVQRFAGPAAFLRFLSRW